MCPPLYLVCSIIKQHRTKCTWETPSLKAFLSIVVRHPEALLTVPVISELEPLFLLGSRFQKPHQPIALLQMVRCLDGLCIKAEENWNLRTSQCTDWMVYRATVFESACLSQLLFCYLLICQWGVILKIPIEKQLEVKATRIWNIKAVHGKYMRFWIVCCLKI